MKFRVQARKQGPGLYIFATEFQFSFDDESGPRCRWCSVVPKHFTIFFGIRIRNESHDGHLSGVPEVDSMPDVKSSLTFVIEVVVVHPIGDLVILVKSVLSNSSK